MPRRHPPRTWAQHYAELADNFRPASNAKSEHTAHWDVSRHSLEDAALASLPPQHRDYLTRDMMIILPPSEIAAQSRVCNMLLTLVLINRHALLEAYGDEHPSVTKLTQLIEHLNTQ